MAKITARRVCRISGCRSIPHARGLCNKHHKQFLRNSADYKNMEAKWQHERRQKPEPTEIIIPFEMALFVDALSRHNLRESAQLISAIIEPDWNALAATMQEVAHATTK